MPDDDLPPRPGSLTSRTQHGAAARPPAPRVVSHAFGLRPGIDPDKLGQLLDELEAEDYAAEVRRLREENRRT